MSFAAIMLAAIAKMRGDTFATRYWKIHLNRSVIGTGDTADFYMAGVLMRELAEYLTEELQGLA